MMDRRNVKTKGGQGDPSVLDREGEGKGKGKVKAKAQRGRIKSTLVRKWKGE